MFFFHSSKIEGPNLQPLSNEKTDLWCFSRLSTKTFVRCFSSITWKYLGKWWHVIFDIYTFLHTCKLYTICLFRCFSSNSILLSWISIIYFNFCDTSLWLLMWHILKAIQKSMNWYLNIGINSNVLFFSYRNFIEKIKHLHMIITTLVLNYLAPVSLCYN